MTHDMCFEYVEVILNITTQMYYEMFITSNIILLLKSKLCAIILKMSLTPDQIGQNGPPIVPEYGCLSFEAGERLAGKVDKITSNSNPFSVVLPAQRNESLTWSQQILAAHETQTRKKHIDLGQPVVKGFFASLQVNDIDEVLEYCKNHIPPLNVVKENFDPQKNEHYRLIEHLDAVPINSVVVTFSVLNSVTDQEQTI